MDRFKKLNLNYGRDSDSDSEDEDKFDFPDFVPSFNFDHKQEQEPPKKASVYAFAQPLSVRFLPGEHRGVLVNRPEENGGPKVIENDNAYPDGVIFKAENKGAVRKATPEELEKCKKGDDCFRVGSVSLSSAGTEKLIKIDEKIRKENPFYRALPKKEGEINCQDHQEKVVEALGLDAKKLKPKEWRKFRKT